MVTELKRSPGVGGAQSRVGVPSGQAVRTSWASEQAGTLGGSEQGSQWSDSSTGLLWLQVED